jgi:hypothetical protein
MYENTRHFQSEQSTHIERSVRNVWGTNRPRDSLDSSNFNAMLDLPEGANIFSDHETGEYDLDDY